MTGLEDFISSDFAPLGRSFCNPPALLFETMIKRLKQIRVGDRIDVLFLTGDLIGHKNNNEREDFPAWDADKFKLMMETHAQLSNILHQELPDTIVIPTFGNNDFDLDDEPANET